MQLAQDLHTAENSNVSKVRTPDFKQTVDNLQHDRYKDTGDGTRVREKQHAGKHMHQSCTQKLWSNRTEHTIPNQNTIDT